jgi:starch synthase
VAIQGLKIAIVASESFPYVKTGGLADVVGALPKALRTLGHQPIVILPRYEAVDYQRYPLSPFLSPLGVWMGNTEEWCSVYQSDQRCPDLFINRKNISSALAFIMTLTSMITRTTLVVSVSSAGLPCSSARHGFRPDIVHAHDWQTALVPAYLKIWHWNDSILGNAASLLTIHNIAYQGFTMGDYDYLGLQGRNFVSDKFEDHGRMNFLKGGIVYADMVNTVSPTYANETRLPEYAHGLAPYLNNKGENYVGILNGADYDHWNPSVDTNIPARYSPANLSGKEICKRELQKRFLLDVNPDVPVIGVISRLVSQKGLDMLAQVIEGIVNSMLVQFVILGSGDKGLEYYYGGLPARYPGQIGSFIGYNDELAHWIEAGSDFFVMPSIFEPCGLNQMYSLRYGTLPIVRATGGLEDTVQQYDERSGTGTGFKFWKPGADAIYYTVGWAVSTYFDRKDHMEKMIQTAMAQDFSWERSAISYLDAYEKAMANKRTIGR